MPTNRRRTTRLNKEWITQTHIDWLRDEPYDRARHSWFVWDALDTDAIVCEVAPLEPTASDSRRESVVSGRQLWSMFGAEITDEHVQEYPGTRPARWWQFTAVDMRRRVGGVGTANHERVAVEPIFYCGAPTGWISASDLDVFAMIGSPLKVAAVNPADPPQFESEASYLKRLALFLPGEQRRLKADYYEPDSKLSIVDLE